MRKAKIKAGNDNRIKPGCGAKTKWEDILQIKEGTTVNVIRQCSDADVTMVELEDGTSSPDGSKKYRAGTRRLVPNAALENTTDLDEVAANTPPAWKTGQTRITGS